MKVAIKLLGLQPNNIKPYLYRLISDNGKIDEVLDDEFVKDGYIEQPDEYWGDKSGHAHVLCESCGFEYYSDRTYTGNIVKCPVCGHVELVPFDFVLEDVYNE